MYTKKQFGKELKQKLLSRHSLASISHWINELYILNKNINPKLNEILFPLMLKNVGSGEEYLWDELNFIAEGLMAGDNPLYTRQQFGKELKQKIKNKEDILEIGHWAYSIYSEHMLIMDNDFSDLCIDLDAMSMDPQFERSYEELDNIADRLIAGENVTL